MLIAHMPGLVTVPFQVPTLALGGAVNTTAPCQEKATLAKIRADASIVVVVVLLRIALPTTRVCRMARNARDAHQGKLTCCPNQEAAHLHLVPVITLQVLRQWQPHAKFLKPMSTGAAKHSHKTHGPSTRMHRQRFHLARGVRQPVLSFQSEPYRRMKTFEEPSHGLKSFRSSSSSSCRCMRMTGLERERYGV